MEKADKGWLIIRIGVNVASGTGSTIHSYCQLFTHECNWNQKGLKFKKTFSLGARGPHVIHPSLHWLHSPPQTTAQPAHALPHNYATKSQLVTMEHPKFTPKLPLPLLWSLITTAI